MQNETSPDFSENHRFKPLGWRADAVKWSFIASFGAQVLIQMLVLAIAFAVAFGMTDFGQLLSAVVHAAGIILLAGTLVLPLIAAITVVLWTYQAMANLHALKAPGLTMTPLWAVGSYFVPPFLFWKPYTAMREIWRGSHSLADEEANPPKFLLWWWVLWVASFMPMRAAYRGRDGVVQQFPPSDLLIVLIGLAQLVAGVVAALLLWRAVSAITRVQAALPERV